MEKFVVPPPLDQLREQQQRMEALFTSPLLAPLQNPEYDLSSTLDPELTAQVAALQADLADRVRGAETARTDDEEDAQEVWFGAASWAALIAEIEGLLKGLEIMVTAMMASHMALGAPIPTAVLALLIVLVSAAEFALWLAKRDIGE